MKKRLILFTLIYLLIFIYFSGCGDDNNTLTIPDTTLGTKNVYVFAPAVSNTKLTAGQEAEFKKTGLTAIFENSAPSSYIPVSGATVTIGDATGTTDGTGHVLLTGIPYGLYDMMVEHPDYDFFHQEIPVANPNISATEFTNPRIIPDVGIRLIPSLMQFHAVADTPAGGIIEFSGTWTSEETETNTTEKSIPLTGSDSKGLFAINPDNGISFIEKAPVENCLFVSVCFTYNNLQNTKDGANIVLEKEMRFTTKPATIHGFLYYEDKTTPLAFADIYSKDGDTWNRALYDENENYTDFYITVPVQYEVGEDGTRRGFIELDIYSGTSIFNLYVYTHKYYLMPIDIRPDGTYFVSGLDIYIPFPPGPTPTPTPPDMPNLESNFKTFSGVYPHFSGNTLHFHMEFNSSITPLNLNEIEIEKEANPDFPFDDVQDTSSIIVSNPIATWKVTHDSNSVRYGSTLSLNYIAADDVVDIYVDFGSDQSDYLKPEETIRLNFNSDEVNKGYLDVTLTD